MVDDVLYIGLVSILKNNNFKNMQLKSNICKRKGPVVYWMSRDQRVQHNWALIFSIQLAIQLNNFFEVFLTKAFCKYKQNVLILIGNKISWLCFDQ